MTKKKVKITTEEKARQDCEKAGITDLDFIKEWEAYRYKRDIKMKAGAKRDTIQEHYAKWKQQHDNGTAPAVMSKELKIEAPAPEPDDTETGTGAPEKPSNLKWWIIGGMGGALLIAIVVIIILATRKK